jgi:hypothetical protein
VAVEGLPDLEETLTDGAVRLRPWLAADLPLVEEAASDPVLRVGTTLPRRFTPAEGAAYIERQWSRQTRGEGWSLAITFDGRTVGCATLMLRRPAIADLGYWLVDRARGGGSAAGRSGCWWSGACAARASRRWRRSSPRTTPRRGDCSSAWASRRRAGAGSG